MGLTYIVRYSPHLRFSLKHAVKQDGKTFCGKDASKWTDTSDIEDVGDSCVRCYHIILMKEAKYVG